MTSPRPITFSGASALNLSGGPLNDNFIISGSAAGIAAVFNGNLGNDTISLSGLPGNFASPVTVNGNGGTDIVRFSSASVPDFFTGTLRNTSFAANGLSHSYATFETVNVQSGSGGSDITMQSVPQLVFPAISLTVFTGGSGADLITVGTGNLGSTLRGNVSVTGGSGSDTLVLDDSGVGGNTTYTFDQGNRFFMGTNTLISVIRGTGVEREILQACQRQRHHQCAGRQRPADDPEQRRQRLRQCAGCHRSR